ncbi:MAG: YbbR-like domain-containing protein [Bacteroidaceae bacterium]|nr:YbbR-like domain-containing protein [Bacteroidaceae bacterium]
MVNDRMSKAGSRFKQWKDKLFGRKSHELLVFCFFLAVSFGFWILQALNETLVREVNVRLELENVPSDVVIIDSIPPTLSVTLQNRGLALARHSFSTFFRPNRLKIDFTKYDTGKNDAEVYIATSEIQRMLGHIFVTSMKIQSIRPDTIRFTYNHGLSRKLPVKFAGDIKAHGQNYIQSILVEPDSVKVFAPAEVLDTMLAVYTEPFHLDGLHETGSYAVPLRHQKLLKYDPSVVNIKVGVGYYTEKTVKVPIIGLNFPAEKKLRTFPAWANITFRIESGRYNKITSEDFVLATTYEELLQETESSKLTLRLKNLPEGVSNVRISPREVDYLIEQAVPES